MTIHYCDKCKKEIPVGDEGASNGKRFWRHMYNSEKQLFNIEIKIEHPESNFSDWHFCESCSDEMILASIKDAVRE